MITITFSGCSPSSDVPPEQSEEELKQRVKQDWFERVTTDWEPKYLDKQTADTIWYENEFYGIYDDSVFFLSPTMLQAGWDEKVGEYVFKYINTGGMWCWNDGEFSKLSESYEKGFLSEQALDEIYYLYWITFPSCYGEEAFKERVKIDWFELMTADWEPELTEGLTADTFWRRSGNVFYKFDKEVYVHSPGDLQEEWEEEIGEVGYKAEYVFKYNDSGRIWGWISGGKFNTLSESYQNGYLSKQELDDIYSIHQQSFPFMYEAE